MNKKGFTLAELLGVIVLLGILATVAFPPLLNQLNKSKEKIYRKVANGQVILRFLATFNKL